MKNLFGLLVVALVAGAGYYFFVMDRPLTGGLTGAVTAGAQAPGTKPAAEAAPSATPAAAEAKASPPAAPRVDPVTRATPEKPTAVPKPTAPALAAMPAPTAAPRVKTIHLKGGKTVVGQIVITDADVTMIRTQSGESVSVPTRSIKDPF